MKRVPKAVWIAFLAIFVLAILTTLGVYYYPRWQDDRAFASASELAASAGPDNQSALKAYLDYLDEYPQGLHAEEAAKKKGDLEKSIEKSIDDDAFDRAENSAKAAGPDNLAALKAYQEYLSAYPRGLHSKDAKEKEKELSEKVKEHRKVVLKQAQNAEQVFAAGGMIFLSDIRLEGSQAPGINDYSAAYTLAPGTDSGQAGITTKIVFADGSTDAGNTNYHSLNGATGRISFSAIADVDVWIQGMREMTYGSIALPGTGELPANPTGIEVSISSFGNDIDEDGLVSNVLSISL